MIEGNLNESLFKVGGGLFDFLLEFLVSAEDIFHQ